MEKPKFEIYNDEHYANAVYCHAICDNDDQDKVEEYLASIGYEIIGADFLESQGKVKILCFKEEK